MKTFQRITLLSALFWSTTAFGQSVSSLAPSIPASPQAEAIKRHGNYNVNMSTGKPEISIPLFDIEHWGFKMPVSLRYVASPLRPGYNFDAYGIGWTLSLSSCVSRSIEFIPDEWNDFKLEVPGVRFNQFYQCGTGCTNEYNFAHDKFNAVLPDGSSFDFIIDNPNGTIVYKVSEGRKVKISHVNNGQIQSFTITDENGIKYTFDGADNPRSGSGMFWNSSFVSWMLSRIDLPGNPDPILFNYSQLITPAATSCGEYSASLSGSNRPIEQSSGNIMWEYIYNAQKNQDYIPNAFQMRLLTSIVYGPAGRNVIQLTHKNQSTIAQSYQVDKIKQYEASELMKEIELTTSMHGSSSLCQAFPLAKLDLVTIKGKELSGNSVKYECTYDPISTSGVDHWGYRNTGGNDLPNFNAFINWEAATPSHISAAGMVVLTKDVLDVNPFQKLKLSFSGNASIDSRAASGPGTHGVLTRLKYPTGGYTEFHFENHKFFTSMAQDGNYIYDPQNKITKDAAGFRIRSITNYTAEGSVAGKKSYRYGKTNRDIYGPEAVHGHTNTGEAVVDPNTVTYLGFALYGPYAALDYYSLRQMVLGLDQYNQRVSFANPFHSGSAIESKWIWECNFSASNFRRALGGRQPVVYSDVTEYDGEGDEEYNNPSFPLGKTVYKYKLTSSEIPGANFFEPSQYYGNTLSYEARPYLYAQLEDKSTYSYNNQTRQFKKLRSEISMYTPDNISYYDYEYGNNYVGEQMTGPYLSADGDHGLGWISGVFAYKSIYMGKNLLTGKEITEFDDAGNSITTLEDYSYYNPVQLASSGTITSDGRRITKNYNYPGTGSTPGPTPTAVIADMVSKNIISPVLSEATTVTLPDNQSTIVAGNQIEYGYFGTPQVLRPAKSYQLEVGPASSAYSLGYEVKSYSSNGLPLETVSKGNLYNTYLWGYDDRYMIANVSNAKSADVAYTSFEAVDKGNWTFSGALVSDITAPTGKNVYNLTNGSISKSGLSSTTPYTLTYWSKNGPLTIVGTQSGYPKTHHSYNGWQFYEHRMQNQSSVTLSGTALIDEVRLYPASAQMITYTYEPLTGVTSETNQAGKTIYYVYDLLNRLHLVKDHQGNILKQICYNYAGQPENCGTN